ncbi:spermatogenesis-associated protein 20-like isoform X2 [Artemia franciscana]
MATAYLQHNENRLSQSKSPYLLQHKNNPVDWYPWGEEAIQKARRENKLIFLSVGYSTCHWCHVMERESFENDNIAKIMNENFINIKVDREERPDVDKMYMSFVTAISGSGGWPMSVFLTPNLEPVFGGTYFPPDERYFGQPSFPSVLQQISKQWRENPGRVANSGKEIIAALASSSKLGGGTDLPSFPSVKKGIDQLMRSYEPKFGGFGHAPKFPQPSNFNLIFAYYARNSNDPNAKRALQACLHTLECMRRGGIHDHVSQGFARYSTDSEWHVPHFEKMLYDQAQLAVAYTNAYLATKNEVWKDVVDDILTYVSRDLSDASGGFYSAEDADSYPYEGANEKKEGAFCVWTFDELQNHLEGINFKDGSPVFPVFCEHFGVSSKGNVSPSKDPHKELTGKNVLIMRKSEEETADKHQVKVEELKLIFKRALNKLHEIRQSRPRPHLDDKIIAAWNGLMLTGFARAGFIFNNKNYLDRAQQNAEFLEKYLCTDEGTLIRSIYKGPDHPIQISEPIHGFADDYAFVIRGFLDLHMALQDEHWLQLAYNLQKKMDSLFWDETEGAYYQSPAGDPHIMIRLKEDQDGAEPTSSSVAVENLVRLGALLDDATCMEKARKTLSAFKDRIDKIPVALTEMLCGFMMYNHGLTEVSVAGRRNSTDTAALVNVLRENLIPDLGFLYFDQESSYDFIKSTKPAFKDCVMIGEEATAYVCRNKSCAPPCTNRADLANILKTI